MINWKIPAGFAGFAVLVAFISGAIGGVPFGTILLRAVLSGVIFGSIGYGMLFLFKSRLPELFSLLSPGAKVNPMSEGVDIVISDDTEETLPPEPSVEEVADSLLGKIAEDDADTAPPSSDELIEEVEERSIDSVSDSGDQEASEEVAELFSADDEGAVAELETIDETFDKFGNSGGLSDIASSEADTIEVLGEFQDPKDVAKAVQTMMKRDEQ